jgi:organic radical activating enzyme
MRIEYKDIKKNNWFLITWDLSNKCNYRCTYCPGMFHDGSSGWPDINEVKGFVKKINELLPEKNICFRISGGEPTYWKHFIDFARCVKSYGNSFSYLTNGSRDITYFKTINQLTDGMILSYHPEYSKKEHFIGISKVIDCPIAVNLMIVPEKFDEIISLAEYLYLNSNMAIWPKVILDKINMTNNVALYSEEQRLKIKNWKYFRKLDDTNIHRGPILLDGIEVSANDLILQSINKYNGWTCWSGIDQINISFEGNIYRADCQVGGIIGTIKDFKLPSTPQICNKESCTCLSDIYLRKNYE